jgi:hypothetical protein
MPHVLRNSKRTSQLSHRTVKRLVDEVKVDLGIPSERILFQRSPTIRGRKPLVAISLRAIRFAGAGLKAYSYSVCIVLLSSCCNCNRVYLQEKLAYDANDHISSTSCAGIVLVLIGLFNRKVEP